MSIYLRTPKRLLVRKTLVGLLLLGVGAVCYLLFQLAGIDSLSASWARFIPLFATIVLFLTVYKPLDHLVRRFFHRYVFRKSCQAHQSLLDLARELRSILDLQEVTNLIVNSFGEILKLKTVMLVIKKDPQEDFEVVSAYGCPLFKVKKIRVSQQDSIAELLKYQEGAVLVRDDIRKSFHWKEANPLSQDLEKLQAAWVLPIFHDKELIGFLTFSSGNPMHKFHPSDFHFFKQFSKIISVCLFNALYVDKMKTEISDLQDSQTESFQLNKMEAIKSLAGGISHEIHNPLTIISGKAQMALMKLQKGEDLSPAQLLENFKSIVQQTKRAADITKRLTSYCGDIQRVEKRWLDLEKEILEAVDIVHLTAKSKNVRIHVHSSESLPNFYGRAHELKDIFFHLLMNALDSLDVNGEVELSIFYQKENRLFEVRISDNGRGMDPELIDSVFNPFYKTKHESVGLGLFFVKQQVHRHGGTIRVESRPGEGTVFIIHFPMNEEEIRDESHETEKVIAKGDIYEKINDR